MSSKVLMAVVCSAAMTFAAESMNISVCNIDEVPSKTLARAEAVVTTIFSQSQVAVAWSSCDGSGPGARVELRLWRECSADSAQRDSRHVMGMAFTAPGVTGTMADVYYGVIEQFAKEHEADPAEVLGYVVAHEIGHLLLGPGHSAGGIMTAVWNGKTLAAGRQHWLTFTQAQRNSIRRELRARNLAAPVF